MKYTSWFFFMICLFPLDPIQGQVNPIPKNRWVRVKEYKNFESGIYSPQYGAKLQLISLYRSFSSYEFGKNQALRVSYVSPKSEVQSFFAAQEKNVSHYYRMQSKELHSKRGENTIDNWTVDGILKQYAILSENLAVLLQFDKDKITHFIPVDVSVSKIPDKKSAFVWAIYRINTSISGGVFRLYKGEYTGILPKDKEIHKGRIGMSLEGKTIAIRMPVAKTKSYEGWVTLDVTLYVLNRSEKKFHRMFFYVKGNE